MSTIHTDMMSALWPVPYNCGGSNVWIEEAEDLSPRPRCEPQPEPEVASTAAPDQVAPTSVWIEEPEDLAVRGATMLARQSADCERRAAEACTNVWVEEEEHLPPNAQQP